MGFKEELIQHIKEYPDVFNEIRVETIKPESNSYSQENDLVYIIDPSQDTTLEELEDSELIDSIIRNLKYYIEYERELGESDV